MNKLLIAIFDSESASNTGLQALRKLHTQGDITLYATGLLAKDKNGVVSVKKSLDPGPVGTATGFAVGSLIGLLGGPLGVAIGALTGTVAGAIRDLWVAGVGLDFIEEAEKHLRPGKVALVAEIEEEWVMPVDAALEAAGGHIFRRARTEIAEEQFDNDISAFKSEIKELESEVSHATAAAKPKLEAKLAAANASLDGAVHRAQQRIDVLKQEADAKVDSLKLQLSQATGEVKAKIEDRMKRVKSAYQARGAKLSKAWHLTKEALTA